MAIMSLTSCRDPRAEQRWLVVAELSAGQSGFTRHALMRLDAGQQAYGEGWTARPVDELLGELAEEAADLGAWGVLALQALELGRLDRTVRARIADLLRDAILAGAQAHRALVDARRELAHAHANAPRRTQARASGGCDA